MRALTGVDERVVGLVRDEFGVDDHQLGADMPLADLLIDSLALVELVMVLEDAFDVGIADADLADLQTVGDLCTTVRARLGRAPDDRGGLLPGAPTRGATGVCGTTA